MAQVKDIAEIVAESLYGENIVIHANQKRKMESVH
jgi:hypothetical protein